MPQDVNAKVEKLKQQLQKAKKDLRDERNENARYNQRLELALRKAMICGAKAQSIDILFRAIHDIEMMSRSGDIEEIKIRARGVITTLGAIGVSDKQ